MLVSSCACGPSTSSAPENTSVRFPPPGYAHGHQEQQLPALLPSPGTSQPCRIQKPKRRRSNSVSSSVVEALNGEQKNGTFNSSILSGARDQLGSPKADGAPSPQAVSPTTSRSIQADTDTCTPPPHNPCSNQSLPNINPSRGPSIDLPAAIRPLSRRSPEGEASPNKKPSNSAPTTNEQDQNSRQVGVEVCGNVGFGMQEEMQVHGYSGFDEQTESLQTDQKRNGRCCGSVPDIMPPVQQPGSLVRLPYGTDSPSQRHTPHRGDTGTLQLPPEQYNVNKSQLPIQAQSLQQMAYPQGVFPFFPYQQPAFQQSPATIVYTFPPPYSTFQNPLTPQELAFLHSNAHRFSQSTSQPISAGHFGGIVPASTGSIPMMAHNCSCGNGCDCLGCAAHPYNNKTMNFVRSLRDIMGAEIGQGSSRGHIQAHYGSQSPTALAPMGSSGCCSNRNNSTQLQETSQSCVGVYNTTTELSPRAAAWPPLPSSEESPATAATPKSPTNLASQSPWPKVGESDIENDEEESISPSAYFHVDYPIWGCTEEKDGCLCDEGCTCVGCLTHGGHDGVKFTGFPTNLGGGLMTNDGSDRTTQEDDSIKRFSGGAEGTAPFAFIPPAMNGSGF